MGRLLRQLPLVAGLLLCKFATAQDSQGENHEVSIRVNFDAVIASSPLTRWPAGGLGKLRFDESSSFESSRVLFEYEGRIRQTLWARVIADYIDDGSSGIDVAEAFLTWRPVPRRNTKHQFRFGAMYPPFSYENSDRGWASPYSISFSAINTWLGEEIRPVGAEWSMTRRVGRETSPHQIKIFTSAFWANDPAGTLLFWRGWSVHDRQSRLDDRLRIPSIRTSGLQGSNFIEQTVAPFVETDSQPGFYAGVEWRLARRIRGQVGAFDNRADPWSFSRQQWGWNTRFWSASLQAELPKGIGVIAQSMSGDTVWVTGALQDGTIAGSGRLVKDQFDSSYILLTRQFAGKHRVSFRYETFAIERPESGFIAEIDDGSAITLAYRFSPGHRLNLSAEWLEIDSERDLWSRLYSVPRQATERMFRVQLNFDLDIRI